MNVLYYLGSFPKLSESFILNEIYELEKRGHNVTVFALEEPDEEIEHEEYQNLDIPIRYARVPRYSDVLELVSSRVLHPRILKNLGHEDSIDGHIGNLLRSKQCIKYLEEENLEIDHVHAHFASLATFPGRYVSSYFDVSFSITVHAAELYRNPDIPQLSHIFGRSDHVVTISEYNKRYIETEITDTTPISVVHAGIRPEKFTPSSTTRDHRIITVARFIEKKGLKNAITAVSNLVDEFPDIEYHIIGSGPLESDLRDLIGEYRLDENVEILGSVTDEQLIREIDVASCFLLPCQIAESGDRDGIPVALMESMAMETPPVSTTVSGIPELIDDGENGYLVDPKDSEGLAFALSSLLSNPEKREKFGVAGRKKVIEEFNVEKEASKLERVFQTAMSES